MEPTRHADGTFSFRGTIPEGPHRGTNLNGFRFKLTGATQEGLTLTGIGLIEGFTLDIPRTGPVLSARTLARLKTKINSQV